MADAPSSTPAPSAHFLVRRKVASYDSYTVTSDDGTTVYAVKFHMHLSKLTWTFVDASGAEVATLVRPPMHAHPTFEVDRPGHEPVTVRKANFMPVRETWKVEGTELGDLDVSGNTTDHEFVVTDPSGATVAEASRKWATVLETYAVRCTGMPPELAAATAVAIDVVEHQQH